MKKKMIVAGTLVLLAVVATVLLVKPSTSEDIVVDAVETIEVETEPTPESEVEAEPDVEEAEETVEEELEEAGEEQSSTEQSTTSQSTDTTQSSGIVIESTSDDTSAVVAQSAEEEAQLAFDSRVAKGCPVCGSTTCATFDYDNLTVDSSRCDQYSDQTNAALYCQICGKENGDGTNGTCCTPMWDTTCYYCGESILAGECHTCE